MLQTSHFHPFSFNSSLFFSSPPFWNDRHYLHSLFLFFLSCYLCGSEAKPGFKPSCEIWAVELLGITDADEMDLVDSNSPLSITLQGTNFLSNSHPILTEVSLNITATPSPNKTTVGCFIDFDADDPKSSHVVPLGKLSSIKFIVAVQSIKVSLWPVLECNLIQGMQGVLTEILGVLQLGFGAGFGWGHCWAEELEDFSICSFSHANCK